MTCNSEEQGTLILPSAALVPLRNTLVEAINRQREEWLTLAAKVHERLSSEQGKADRKVLSNLLQGKPSGVLGIFNLSDFFTKKINVAAARADGYSFSLHGSTEGNRDEDDRTGAIMTLLLTPKKAASPGAPAEPRRLQSPKKKDLAPLLASRTWSFSNGDCSVSINPETRVLNWNVYENNHAVERAWESLLGRTLRVALAKIQWTRGTGGGFRYTDEYAQDGAMENGGNPISLTHCHGPLGEALREESGMTRSSRRSSLRR